MSKVVINKGTPAVHRIETIEVKPAVSATVTAFLSLHEALCLAVMSGGLIAGVGNTVLYGGMYEHPLYPKYRETRQAWLASDDFKVCGAACVFPDLTEGY